MDPVVRRKVPAYVRTLLTDIGPREEQRWSEWEDTESETVTTTRDGIALPRRRTADSAEILTPAGERERASSDGDAATQSRVCGLCLSKPSSYTCPRCNVPYCGLACYRSPDHSVCSEEFYKESVFQELKSRGVTETEGRTRMQEILLRLKQNAEGGEGGMENILREEEGKRRCVGTGEEAQALELLSRLAEIQSTGDEENGEEIENILLKLKHIGESESVGGFGEDGNEADEEDLAEKFAGLDIDSLSEEELWALLTCKDKEKFEDLVKGGGIGRMVPLWSPWWERHEEGKEALMEVLEEERLPESMNEEGGDTTGGQGGRTTGQAVKMEKEGKIEHVKEGVNNGVREKEGCVINTVKGEDAMKTERPVEVDDENKKQGSEEAHDSTGKSVIKQGRKKQRKKTREAKGPNSATAVPSVSVKIPPLRSLSSHPSPLVCYSLVNVLYGYTFSLHLFNGDLSEPELVQEFCQAALAVSESLGSGRVVGSLPEALEAGVTAVSAGGYFDREDPGAPARAVEAVAHVLAGQSKRDEAGYSLAALSQLRAALTQARGSLPKEGDGGEARRKYFLAGKKCEFLQSWVKENAHTKRLAGGVWREHRRREAGRMALEKEKSVVEEGWKKGTGRGKGVLIEEIN